MKRSNDSVLSDSPGRVLVVDDNPVNRELIICGLESDGYEILEAADGVEALEAVKQRPDVVLLDIMMPPPDGFEVCRSIKKDPVSAPIQVILVTALIDREVRLRGIQEGANDFLTKPIDLRETKLRVRNAVYTKKLFDLAEFRYQRQVELEELRDSLVHMIIHDLKSPVMSIMGYTQLLRHHLEQVSLEGFDDLLTPLSANCHRLNEMISSVLDVSRLEAGELELSTAPVLVADLLAESAEILSPLQRNQGALEFQCPPDLSGHFDRTIIQRVLCNLVENALRALGKEGMVSVSAQETNGRLLFEVRDNGRGMPASALEGIFDKFAQIGSTTKHTQGLGLAFCKLAVEAHGGSLSVESELGSGTTFSFDIP